MSETRIPVSARQIAALQRLEEEIQAATMRQGMYLSAILEGADLTRYTAARVEGTELIVEVDDGTAA